MSAALDDDLFGPVAEPQSAAVPARPAGALAASLATLRAIRYGTTAPREVTAPPDDPMPRRFSPADNAKYDAWRARALAREEAWFATDAGRTALARAARREWVDGLRATEERIAREHDHRLRRYAACGLPPIRYVRDVAVAACAPRVTPALEALGAALARWRAEPPDTPLVVVLAGGVGSGKTCALARALTHGREHAEFIETHTLAVTPLNAFSENVAKWDGWRNVALLGVDDAGAEAADPAILGALVKQRYDHGRATLVTTNLSGKDFLARYCTDARLASRLRGQRAACGVEWYLESKGGDLRTAGT